MNDAYLDHFQALILEHFELPIHQFILEVVNEKCDMKITLRKHLFAYNQRSGDRTADLTAKMKACADIDAKLCDLLHDPSLHCGSN
jgi:hypothetical protein